MVNAKLSSLIDVSFDTPKENNFMFKKYNQFTEKKHIKAYLLLNSK